MRIRAHILTCPERAAVLRNTLANLRASDWAVEPAVYENRDGHPDRRVRIQRGTRAVLERAVESDAEWMLHLEDDLVFNRHLRENLARWPPLTSASPERPFYASLFRPPGLALVEENADSNSAQVAADRAYGNQALLLSRATVRHILTHWDEEVLEADHRLARLAGRLGPLHLHLPSLVQHVGRRSAWGGPFLQTADFAPSWRGGAGNGPDWPPLTDTTARAAMEAFVDQLPPSPGGFSGTGVVIAAGGLGYLVNAWVAVRMLRHHGSRLPIQIWHLGPEEMPEPLARLFRGEGVDCVDAHRLLDRHPARQLGGWALKPYAMLASSFRHVLLLDADNVAVSDPGYLFDDARYQATGAIFWPDRPEGVGVPGKLLGANHPIWRLSGLGYRGDPSFESGQICLDKQRCWRELRLAMWMNEHADFWYRFLYGDKDTFQIAWRKLGTSWAMPALRPHMPDRRVFGQLDFDGRVIFQHRSGDKWRLDGANAPIAGFVHEEQCRQAIAELRERLLPGLGVGGERQWRLAPAQWLWSRHGHPPRVLSFHPGGFVDGGGQGDHDGAVRLWKLAAGSLELLGDDLTIMARFRHVPRAQAWLGVNEAGASLARVANAAGPTPPAAAPQRPQGREPALRAILCCAGEGERWGNYLGVPKHLVAIDGVPLVRRSVQQLRARGIEDVVITTFDDRYALAGAALAAPAVSMLPDTGIGFSVGLWSTRGRTLVLLGDVYFSEAAMDAIVTAAPDEITWLGRKGAGRLDKYCEMFGVSIPLARQARLQRAAEQVVELRRREAIQRMMGWELYAVVNDLDVTRVMPGPNWIDIDDETEDFDYPADYDAWMRCHRTAG
jgi:hypothetical protein